MNEQTLISRKPSRDSNIELLRIIVMYFIIAHHEIVNSGVWDLWNYSTLSPQMIFTQLWGMWGKTGINVFVLIAGWFMCTSHLTAKRWLKMFLEVKFYSFACFVALAIAGYQVVTAKSLFMVTFEVLRDINDGFIGSFLAFYLFIPFYNMILEKATKKQLLYLIGCLLTIFTFTATFLIQPKTFTPIGWYVTLYFVAAYLRLYPAKWMSSLRVTGVGLILSISAAVLSVLAIDFAGLHHYVSSWYFLHDSSALLAFVVGVFALLAFKNINLGHSPRINLVASTTFGVFLLHTASDAMRQWLWRDLFNMPGIFQQPCVEVVAAFVLIPVAVFAIGALVDFVRIRLIEKPLFGRFK